MIRVLLGLLLVEAMIGGVVGLVAWSSGLLLQEDWRVRALAADRDREVCETRLDTMRRDRMRRR